MIEESKILYWFTPFFRRSDLIHFLNQSDSEKSIAFFCYDALWNRTGPDDMQYLKSELKKRGIQLIVMEGKAEKTVPSVARVLKAARVVFLMPEAQHDFKCVISRICSDLELHSISFCHDYSGSFPLLRNNEPSDIRQAI
jgi:deoxyribodipyrimidine photolyase